MRLPLSYNYKYYSFLRRVCMFIKANGRMWLLSWDTASHFSWINSILWSLSVHGYVWIMTSLSLDRRDKLHSWSSVIVLSSDHVPLTLVLSHFVGGNFGKYLLSWEKDVVKWKEKIWKVNRGSWNAERITDRWYQRRTINKTKV